MHIVIVSLLVQWKKEASSSKLLFSRRRHRIHKVCYDAAKCFRSVALKKGWVQLLLGYVIWCSICSTWLITLHKRRRVEGVFRVRREGEEGGGRTMMRRMRRLDKSLEMSMRKNTIISSCSFTLYQQVWSPLQTVSPCRHPHCSPINPNWLW